VVQTAAYEGLAQPWPSDDDTVRREIEEWADALVIGPGLGGTPEARATVERVLGATKIPAVIDADGLNAFAGRADALGAALAGRPAILTPHPGEFARLTGTTIDAVLDARFEVGATLAATLGATVLLKGVPTVISAPDGTRFVSATGGPA